MTKISASTLCVVLLIVSSLCWGQDPDYRIADEPDWINQIQFAREAGQVDSATSGYQYLLADYQTSVGEQHDYTHIAFRILSPEALREMSNITLDFDPSYQELILHRVSVIRQDEVMDRLDLSAIKVMQRESAMEQEIYDGHKTVVMNLKNVRIGDIIEYSFSIIGYNPVFDGQYARVV